MYTDVDFVSEALGKDAPRFSKGERLTARQPQIFLREWRMCLYTKQFKTVLA